MAKVPNIKSVELEANYYHVRFRDPGGFEKIKTPDWASKIADSISEGSRVRMGKKDDEWRVQSVLIPKGEGGKKNARGLARKISKKVEE